MAGLSVPVSKSPQGRLSPVQLASGLGPPVRLSACPPSATSTSVYSLPENCRFSLLLAQSDVPTWGSVAVSVGANLVSSHDLGPLSALEIPELACLVASFCLGSAIFGPALPAPTWLESKRQTDAMTPVSAVLTMRLFPAGHSSEPYVIQCSGTRPSPLLRLHCARTAPRKGSSSKSACSRTMTKDALSRTVRRHSKRIRSFSGEQKYVTFAATARAIEAPSPPLSLNVCSISSVPGWGTFTTGPCLRGRTLVADPADMLSIQGCRGPARPGSG